MAYLGRGLDKISNIEVLDNITFDGSSSYSITKGSVAFTPNSAQSLLISIDGVVQATNFTVNSSTIDFGVAIPSTSVCNFFLHYGTGVMTVPSDGSVTTAKLGSNAVTSAKLSYPLTTFSSTGIDDNASATAMTINSSGSITKPNQPAFLAHTSSVQSNISSGTTIILDTERFDQQNNFASNTFTAPITGKYKFDFLVSVNQLDYNASYNRVRIRTSNKNYNFGITSAQMFNSDPTYFTFEGSLLVDMDASDTCYLQWHQIGGTSSADIMAGDSTFFSGHLVC